MRIYILFFIFFAPTFNCYPGNSIESELAGFVTHLGDFMYSMPSSETGNKKKSDPKGSYQANYFFLFLAQSTDPYNSSKRKQSKLMAKIEKVVLESFGHFLPRKKRWKIKSRTIFSSTLDILRNMAAL